MPNMTIDELADVIKGEFNRIDERFEGIDKRFDRIEATMVTKDYLDDKLADLKGDMVVMMRKEDTKFMALVDLLKTRNVISSEDAEKIMTMEPFAKMIIK